VPGVAVFHIGLVFYTVLNECNCLWSGGTESTTKTGVRIQWAKKSEILSDGRFGQNAIFASLC